MNDDGKWDDGGTRHVSVDCSEVCLFLAAVSIHFLLIFLKLQYLCLHAEYSRTSSTELFYLRVAVVVYLCVHTKIPSIAVQYI